MQPLPDLGQGAATNLFQVGAAWATDGVSYASEYAHDTASTVSIKHCQQYKLYVSFAKEPYKRDDILQKRPIILSILVLAL